VVQEGEVSQLSPSREVGFNEGVGKRCAWNQSPCTEVLRRQKDSRSVMRLQKQEESGGSGELVVAEESEKRCVLVS
jgi:hypothetical protein